MNEKFDTRHLCFAGEQQSGSLDLKHLHNLAVQLSLSHQLPQRSGSVKNRTDKSLARAEVLV